MRRTLVVTEPNAGRRVDALVRRELGNIALAPVMKWLRTGVIRVNGKKAKPAQRLAAGDAIAMPDTSTPLSNAKADEIGILLPSVPKPKNKAKPLAVIYEDDDILIVDKPAMLAAHAGTGQLDSLADRVEAYLDAANAAVGHKPALAQRLDRGVSGLVLIGKNAKALRLLAESITKDGIRKIYRAIVLGKVADATGDITVPLRVDDERMGDRPRVHPDPNALPAHTHYKRVEVMNAASLLDVEIHTGRTHQIRAHLRYIGHPLIGDPRYGSPKKDTQALGPSAMTALPQRPAMHARLLTFEHPTRHGTLTFEAPMPADLMRLLGALRQDTPS
ncbi:MAG: RluA family pseudouridine synthase [Clostridia bacterium]|nr:RluA family pseudouridine synthase [Deltaproteobacteria bacterium]